PPSVGESRCRRITPTSGLSIGRRFARLTTCERYPARRARSSQFMKRFSDPNDPIDEFAEPIEFEAIVLRPPKSKESGPELSDASLRTPFNLLPNSKLK